MVPVVIIPLNITIIMAPFFLLLRGKSSSLSSWLLHSHPPLHIVIIMAPSDITA
jgi:hypothetical protein